MLEPDFVAILACPKCESRPHLRLEGKWLICTECQFGYEIIDEIPQLLSELAVSPEQIHERA